MKGRKMKSPAPEGRRRVSRREKEIAVRLQEVKTPAGENRGEKKDLV